MLNVNVLYIFKSDVRQRKTMIYMKGKETKHRILLFILGLVVTFVLFNIGGMPLSSPLFEMLKMSPNEMLATLAPLLLPFYHGSVCPSKLFPRGHSQLVHLAVLRCF